MINHYWLILYVKGLDSLESGPFLYTPSLSLIKGEKVCSPILFKGSKTEGVFFCYNILIFTGSNYKNVREDSFKLENRG